MSNTTKEDLIQYIYRVPSEGVNIGVDTDHAIDKCIEYFESLLNEQREEKISKSESYKRGYEKGFDDACKDEHGNYQKNAPIK